jgi:hypothetical protein
MASPGTYEDKVKTKSKGKTQKAKVNSLGKVYLGFAF